MIHQTNSNILESPTSMNGDLWYVNLSKLGVPKKLIPG